MTRILSIIGPVGSGKSHRIGCLEGEHVKLPIGQILKLMGGSSGFNKARNTWTEVDWLVNALVVNAFELAYRTSRLLVLDGFPRKMEQARWVTEWIRTQPTAPHARPLWEVRHIEEWTIECLDTPHHTCLQRLRDREAIGADEEIPLWITRRLAQSELDYGEVRGYLQLEAKELEILNVKFESSYGQDADKDS